MTENAITVGVRNDGQIVLSSVPNVAGPVTGTNLIMPRETARWLAKEILRCVGDEGPDKLKSALLEANEMVCRHSVPYGWPAFQDRHGLPHSDQVLRPSQDKSNEQEKTNG